MIISKDPKHSDKKLFVSYVTGFILSLIFTFIPYNLVVNQTYDGNKLLLIILGFAFLQLLIQIVFFLHIGRGPKPNWNLFFFAATASLILVVVGGSVIIMNNLHRKYSPENQTKYLLDREGISQISGKKTGACHMIYQNHMITINNSKVEPFMITAKQCDTLTFNNKDDTKLNIIFGSPKNNTSYAGQSTLSSQKGHTKTITLSEVGDFEYYDSSRKSVMGAFTVDDRD